MKNSKADEEEERDKLQGLHQDNDHTPTQPISTQTLRNSSCVVSTGDTCCWRNRMELHGRRSDDDLRPSTIL